jgi:hypothetical protein
VKGTLDSGAVGAAASNERHQLGCCHNNQSDWRYIHLERAPTPTELRLR